MSLEEERQCKEALQVNNLRILPKDKKIIKNI